MSFDPELDLVSSLTPDGELVVAGGDGTIAWAVRQLVDTQIRCGVIGMGTYNNFARALGMPPELGDAIKVIRGGHTSAVTIGYVNDTPFLETAAVGLFGDAIGLGEALKDHSATAISHGIGAVLKATPFSYQLTGDVDAQGTALSLVFSNTPTTGAAMAVGSTTPTEPTIELSVEVGASRSDLVGRLLTGLISSPQEDSTGMVIRLRSITVTTDEPVSVYADNSKVDMTPVVVRAHARALTMLVPVPAPADG